MWAAVRSRTADDAIVTELYRQYRVPLMTYVLRLTAGDRQQAEDVVQETMLRAWRQVGQARPDRTVTDAVAGHGGPAYRH